jgi:hypothetical protein
MQSEGSDLGTRSNKRNSKRIMNATIVARWDIIQCDTPLRDPTNTEKHTGQQKQHIKKNHWKTSRKRGTLGVEVNGGLLG